MPTTAMMTFEPATAKLDPIYPNGGARMMNVSLTSTVTLPTVSAALAAGASLSIGAYKYQITFVTLGGETTGGAETSITTTSGNQNVNLTAISTGPLGTVARKVYRTAVAGATGTEKLVATINDNTTTTYSDTTADVNLGAAIPSTNGSGLGSSYVRGTVLGELTATPGTYAAYASGNSDGTQTPKAILQYSCIIDAAGNVQLAGEWGQSQKGVPVYVGGGAIFDTTQLIGLDANAVTKLGAALVEGTVSAGQLRF